MYELLDTLRRAPDVEAPNLFASDATDRLVLDEAAAAGQLADAAVGSVVVIGDRYGALTLGAADAYGLSGIRSHQDALTGELALARNARRTGLESAFTSLPLGEELLAGARVVLLQLPRGLAELDEIADAVTRWADPAVVVFAGGRIKHLSRAMNDVLGAHFGEVTVSLARQKSRVLVARGAQRPASSLPYPKLEMNAELGLTVAAHGGAFAGTGLDIGTRFVLGFLDDAVAEAVGHAVSQAQVSPQAQASSQAQASPQAQAKTAARAGAEGGTAPEVVTAIDLGCGTGIIAATLATRHPRLRVIATDQSAAACASAQATFDANGLADRVTVVRDNALTLQADASADLIVCNPPFHIGSSVHTGVALELFRDSGRVLRPGGSLLTVFNSHLAYQPDLRRLVGPTRLLGQSAKFTVARSTRSTPSRVEA